MHPAAYNFVRETLSSLPPRKDVLEYGGRNINGTVRELVESPSYISIDLVFGPGVDRIADAVSYRPLTVPDTVICCEVLEHSSRWVDIVKAAGRILDPETGIFIMTCACNPRKPHSAVDGGIVRDFEYYANIDPMELSTVLEVAGFPEFELTVDDKDGDLQVIAWKKARE